MIEVIPHGEDLGHSGLEELVDVPVNMKPQVPAVQVVPRTMELPLTEFIDRVVDIPVA